MSQDVEKIETSVAFAESVEGPAKPESVQVEESDQSAAPANLLEDFDAKIESAGERRPIRDILVSSDVAAKLAMGIPYQQVAKEAGVNVNTVRRWMRTAAMQDLIAIESRRLIRHMGRRDLSKEKYLALATALNLLTEREQRLRNAEVGVEDRAISVTQIEQINILVRGRERETPSLSAGRRDQSIAASDIPEIAGTVLEDGEG